MAKLSAKEKKQLQNAIQGAGKNLNANEAQRIADRFDVSVGRVASTASRNDVNVKPQVYQRAYSAPAPAPAPQDQGSNTGFDFGSWADANAQRQEDFMSSLSSSFSESLEGILGQFGETLQNLKNNESADRARQAEEQKKRDEEARQSAIDEQLQGLRSGSTVGGTPGSGMEGAGSLASGRSSYQRSFRSALDNYRRSLDPTDSVLDRESGVETMRRERRRDREEGGRRALAGSGGGDYYARRFG